MTEQEHPAWLRRAIGALDESSRDLDAAALSRLNRARQAALGQRRRPLLAWRLPAAFASACALLLALGVWRHVPPDSGVPALAAAELVSGGSAAAAAGAADDLEMVANEDNIELYQDLDFYAWLDAQGEEHDG